MAKERKNNPDSNFRRRSYADIKQGRVDAFIKLQDTVGIENVVFFETKDTFVYREAITPLINVSQAFPIIYQLQGRKLEDEQVKDFKDKYFKIVEDLTNLEKDAIKLISSNGYRNIQDRSLRDKVRTFMRQELNQNNKKEVATETEEAAS